MAELKEFFRPLKVPAMIAAAVIALSIFLISREDPGNRRKRRNSTVPGLINAGNTCFISCIIQALASLPNFTRWLRSLGPSRRDGMLYALQALLEDMKEEHHGALHMMPFTDVLSRHGWSFDNDQQDCYEFYQHLMVALEQEWDQGKESVKDDDVTNAFGCNPFRGLLSRTSKCLNCLKEVSHLSEKMYDLSLTLPNLDKVPLSLHLLLDLHLRDELLLDAWCELCGHSQTIVGLIRCSRFVETPSSLCIHLQRLCINGYGEVMKDSRHVSFPAILDFSHFVRGGSQAPESGAFSCSREENSSGSARILYSLRSCIVHTGQSGRGHFSTYRRQDSASGPMTCSAWLFTSDEHVEPCKLHDVLSSQAYLLFYELITVS